MPFSNTSNALRNRLNQFARDSINDIDNPLLRGLADGLLDDFLGTGGKDSPYADNAFNKLLRQKVNELSREQQIATLPTSNGSADDSPLGRNHDWRARLRPKKGGENQFYAGSLENGLKDYLLKPIQESGGLVWQYTPNIFLSGSVDYNRAQMQGMNYPINTYNYSTPPDIPVSADFTANDQYEARYLLAVFTFLKVATKGYFGDQSVAKGTYGTPPPVLLFEYLGDHGFNRVPVIVTNYNIQYPDNVDYVPVQLSESQDSSGGSITYVPTVTNIMVNLTPQYTPHKVRRQFDVESITNGIAYQQGFI